ncbi:MAG: glycosyltransferase [Planctomycetaceae bacterium]
MKALIFEAYLAGHRGQYAGLLAAELVRLGVETKIAIPANQYQTPEFDVTLAHLRKSAEFVLLPELHHRPGRRLSSPELMSLRAAVKRVRPDHIYIPFADAICRQIALPWNRFAGRLADCPVEALVMFTRGAYPSSGLRDRLRSHWVDHCVSAAPFDRIHTLDAISHGYLNRKSSRICLMPEAIAESDCKSMIEARRLLNLPADRVLVCCPGGVQERKGAHLLIEAVSRMKSGDVSLALIGRHSPYMRRFISENCKNLIVDKRLISKDQFSTNEEFDLLFSAADILAVPYPEHHGSASILIRAARSGKMVITSDRGWPGQMAIRHSLGVTVDVYNSDHFAAALDSMMLTKAAVPSKSCEDFLRFHTVENYLAHWTRLLGELHSIETRKTLACSDVSEDNSTDDSLRIAS